MRVVKNADEVFFFTNEDGDALLQRDPHKWEGNEQVTILIPRANVPSLIAHLQTLMAEGD